MRGSSRRADQRDKGTKTEEGRFDMDEMFTVM